MKKSKTKGRPPRLPANVKRHGSGFVAVVMRDGQRRYSRVCETAKEAEGIAAVWKRTKVPGELLTFSSTFQLLWDDLKAKGASPATIRYYEEQEAVIMAAWPTVPLQRVGPDEIRAWIRIRLDVHKVAPATVAKNVGAVRRLFNVAIRSDKFDGANPVSKVTLPRFRQKRFGHMTPAELSSALQRIRGSGMTGADWDADVIEFMFLSAIRRAEAARLRANGVDLFRKRLRISGKVGDRTLVISKPMGEVLARLQRAAKAAKREALIGGEQDIANVFRRWQDRLKLPGLHAHALRHSAATALVDGGASIVTTQAILGHQTIAMTARYYHGSDRPAKEALDKLALDVEPSTEQPASAGAAQAGA